MKKLGFLLLFFVFLIACSQLNSVLDKFTKSSGNQTSVQQKSQPQQTPEEKEETAQKTATAATAIPISCTDSDGESTIGRGKITITYSNGQKESFSDYCAEGSLGFQIEYTCDGIKPKTKNNRCNQSCSKGACI